MRLLTKNTDYAVRALRSLSQEPGKYLSVKTISEDQGIPYQYLRRILNKLLGAGLVSSKEGIGGGFKLAVPGAPIRLVDVMRVFQGEVTLSECMFRKELCRNRSSCPLRSQIRRIEGMVRREFEKITIGRLV